MLSFCCGIRTGRGSHTPAAGAADMIIAPPKPTEKVGFAFCRHAAVYTPGPQEIR